MWFYDLMPQAHREHGKRSEVHGFVRRSIDSQADICMALSNLDMRPESPFGHESFMNLGNDQSGRSVEWH